MTPFDLTGRVALVTGGNGGLGLGMARALRDAGAKVLVVGRDAAKTAAAAEAIGAAPHVADIARPEAAVEAVAACRARFGRLDVLVNNAGISVRRQPQDLADAEWAAVLDVNLSAAFRLCRAAHPAFVATGGGKVINVASILSLFGAPTAAAYAASKAGMLGLTRSLACAWAPDGVQVNAVLPGYIETDMTDGARAVIPGLYDYVISRTPARRWGQPEDLGGVAVFLASRASDYVTGTAIPVDGGYAAQA